MLTYYYMIFVARYRNRGRMIHPCSWAYSFSYIINCFIFSEIGIYIESYVRVLSVINSHADAPCSKFSIRGGGNCNSATLTSIYHFSQLMMNCSVSVKQTIDFCNIFLYYTLKSNLNTLHKQRKTHER